MTSVSARSDLIRQKLQHVRGHRFGARASGFRSRQETSNAEPGPIFDFASVAALPDWIVATEGRQNLIGTCAAILRERDAIDRELSGDRLTAIAALVGDNLFERLCDYQLPGNADGAGSGRLPRPEDFVSIGAELRRDAKPGLQSDADNNSVDAAQARLLCDIAASIIAAMETGQ